MRLYKPQLNASVRTLRKNMTDSELKLWSRIRRKQLHGLQFYRQRPIGDYVVDFYCPQAQLVLEVDGSQHTTGAMLKKNNYRDSYLKQQGIKILKFDNLQVLNQLDAVIEKTYWAIASRIPFRGQKHDQ